MPGESTTATAATAASTRTRIAARSFERLDFRVALGEEWDSNALRAISSGAIGTGGSGSPPSGPAVGDAVTRLLVDAGGGLDLALGHSLDVEYVLGAKRFATRESEDLLVHDLRASTLHRLSERVSLGPWGVFRASRSRSSARDYSLGAGGLRADYQLTGAVTLEAGGSFFAFEFKPDPHLSYTGPTASGEVVVKPSSRLAFTLHLDYSWRFYARNGLVTSASRGTTLCEDPAEACTPIKRQDRETAVALRGAYRGFVITGAEYLFRAQRSNSDYENTDRHRFSGFLTVPLPFEVTGNLVAAIQINTGVSVTQTRLPFDDDENQNSLQAQLSRRLTDAVGLEVRYALFANQFSTAGVRFFRQTFYLGVSYRLSAQRGP